MSIHNIPYKGVSGNGPSAALWGDCPWFDIQNDPNLGYGFHDDFVDLPTGKYTATQATAGTFVLGDAAGGIAIADSGSTTVTQGINVQLGGTVGAFVVPAAKKTVWFEARVRLTASGTGPEFFLGLVETDTAIIASSAVTISNGIGFSSVTDNNVLLFYGEKATAIATVASNTLVDATWTKLGFKIFTNQLGVLATEQYVNNVKLATSLVAANIPIVGLRPSLVVQTSGTTQPTCQIDWLRVAQLR